MKQWIAMSSLVATAACGNVPGHLSSTKTGDISRPAERASPVESLRTACGDTTSISSDVKRAPYLQQVTKQSALVGWVSGAAALERIALSDAAGKLLPEVPGVIEQAALRSAGERQVWSSLDALQPSTIYCYQLANDAGGMAQRTGFRTAPSADSTAPIRFLAFGDSGGGTTDQLALQEQMYTVPYDLMIHTGDVAYDDGTITQYENNVFGVYGDLFRNIPFFPSSGNHDYKTMNGAPFREVFNLPGDSGEKWYSYDWGRVHFVALDTEADYATQAEWLDRDLAETTADWKIVYMHKPPYSSGQHGSDLALRKLLAPVLKRHRVQLVLSGHDHDYERMIPQDGVAYVVTGGGGIGTVEVGTSDFTAFSEDVIHFIYGEIDTDEMVLHAIDADGREFDSMVIPRTR